MSGKAKEGRFTDIVEAEAEKLGLHSVCNVYDEPAKEFRPHLTQSSKPGS